MSPKYHVAIEVTPKEGMRDPQSTNELRKLSALFPKAGVTDLKVAKLIGFVVDVPNEAEAEALTHRLADELLVQPVLEDYTIDSIEPLDSSTEA